MSRESPSEDGAAGLYERHAARAFRYARMIGLSHADAEDVVGESFLEVVLKVATFRGESSFGTWLFTLVRNRALDMARREGRRRRREDAAAEGPGPGARADDPARAAEEAELGAALADATDSLDPDERSALSLVSAGGLSYADAAAVERVSRSALASRVFRARRRVMRFLADRGLMLMEDGP